MIKVQKLHYEVRRQLNRINTEWDTNIDTVDIDGYLNQAKEILLENYNAIVEKNKTISNRLRSLEIKNKKLTKVVSTHNKAYTFELPSDHYFTLNKYAIGKSKFCDKLNQLFVHNVQTHKIEEALRDPKWQPSLQWRETFSNEDSKGINIYHNDILIIEEVYIDYIRWVPDVANVTDAAGTYITADGETPFEDKHLMINDPILWRKITDIAIFLIKRDFNASFKENIESILFNEKIQTN